MLYLLLLAATVWSLAHLPLGLSNRNNSSAQANYAKNAKQIFDYLFHGLFLVCVNLH